MKLSDLRLRGSGYTFGAVVNKNDHDMFRFLIGYLQDVSDADVDVPESFGFQENPKGIVSTKEKFEEIKCWAVSEGYCTADGETLTFTQKAMDVFERVIALRAKLSAEGFGGGGCIYGCH